MTPMPNAPSPNSIFGQALANTPPPAPLDVVQARMAATRGLNLQNQRTQLEMAGDQALRDAIRNNTRAVPVGAPPSNFPAEPAPGVDDAGNPVRDQGWHSAAAAASAQAPLPNVDAIVRELNAKGYGDRALTFLTSITNLHKSNLENLKTGLELDQAKNAEIGGRVESLLRLAQTDQDGFKKAEAAWPAMANELNQRYNAGLPATFDLDAATNIWRGKVSYDQIIKRQLDTATFGKTEAETTEARSRGQLFGEQAQELEKKRKLRERFTNQLLGTAPPGTPVAVAARLNSGVPGAPDPVADVISNVISKKDNPEDWREAYGTFNNHLANGDIDKAFASLDTAVSRIASARETLNHERELQKFKLTPGSPAYQGEVGLAGAKAAAEETAKERAQGQFFAANQGGISQLAKSIANYDAPLSTAYSNRVPPNVRELVLEQIYRENPEFKAGNYQLKQDTEKNALVGVMGTQRGALSTMMGHLRILNQAADALNNNDFPALNRIANFVGVQVGSTAKTTYETIVHRLGPEVTKAYIAGGGSVGERGTNEEDFSAALAPRQLKANVGVSAQLAGSLIDSLENRYKQGTFGRGNLSTLMSPEAEAARKELATQSPVKGGRITVKAGDGSLHPFNTEAEAKRFEDLVKRAGGTTTRQ